jgi:hypothetical protein
VLLQVKGQMQSGDPGTHDSNMALHVSLPRFAIFGLAGRERSA